MRIIALSQSLPEALWHLYSQIQRRTLPIVNDEQAGSYRFVRRFRNEKRVCSKFEGRSAKRMSCKQANATAFRQRRSLVD